ncbi:hypothetical protein THAOC_25345 [Thalassiosira oceanica]|uniref:Phosphoglycerate mutase n=1 Tax=Thalassiosira oceanica TaxID=159749 RepID=K0RMK8_THAOC|nr:hypothetical protein THAOC_25345 [Thalassiosira oceanica]|eukprot:EJK54978.1 hypothetical protein THAOC_25345 [Thalassiosira oceanica]
MAMRDGQATLDVEEVAFNVLSSALRNSHWSPVLPPPTPRPLPLLLLSPVLLGCFSPTVLEGLISASLSSDGDAAGGCLAILAQLLGVSGVELRWSGIPSWTHSATISSPLSHDDDAPFLRRGRQRTRDDQGKGKRIVLIRHGCTYMNEYLSQKGCRWGDAGFTDQFEEPERTEMYQDSRLSQLGVWQAGELRGRLRDDPIVHEIDLVVCSPLTRALKTMDIALYPFLGIGDGKEGGGSPGPPILALPEASERVYLISDIGRTSAVLKQEFPYVDFDMCRPVRSASGKGAEDDEAWWWQPSSSQSSYVEWRPSDTGQSYACPGEPQFDFERRMKGLYSFLHSREEQTIALVCHWGVVDWLIGKDFDNCEMRVLDFETDFRPKGFAMSDEDAAELFSEGERSASSAKVD